MGSVCLDHRVYFARLLRHCGGRLTRVFPILTTALLLAVSLVSQPLATPLAAQTRYGSVPYHSEVQSGWERGGVPTVPAPQGPLAENPQAVYGSPNPLNSSSARPQSSATFDPSPSSVSSTPRSPAAWDQTSLPAYRMAQRDEPSGSGAWSTGQSSLNHPALQEVMPSGPIQAAPLEPAWRPEYYDAEREEWSAEVREAWERSNSEAESWGMVAQPEASRTSRSSSAPTHERMPSDRGWQYGDSVLRQNEEIGNYWWDGAGRAFYVNDHRIEFTGLEATFGVEGLVRGGGRRECGFMQYDFGGELYLNQPFDQNILVDSPERIAFAPNFDIPAVQISQLAFSASSGDFSASIGKFVTPFGRTYFPILSNSRWETPFIRQEAIGYRETGVLLQYSPGPFRFDAAATNGNEDQDTNSSKALVARIGWESERLAFGGSIKQQDGVGSEDQKYFNNHVGLDAACRFGRWMLCGEIISDQYGYRRAGFAPGGITWGRSLYHRDLQFGHYDPLTGWGFYAAVGREGERLSTWLSYGEFHPNAIGDRIHDTHNRRFLLHGIHHLGGGVDLYGALMLETSIDLAFAGKDRLGQGVVGGFQFGF